MENKIDWSSFTLRISIVKPLSEIYAAWSVKSQIEHWFLERADFTDQQGNARKFDEPFQKDDGFTWKWNNWDGIEKGTILEANGRDKIVFTFGSGGNVALTFKEEERGTEITLMQYQIPEDDESKMNFYNGCATGWTFWLTNLKAWLEHGITLHAKGLSPEETHNLVNS